jgi:hypothetical protein
MANFAVINEGLVENCIVADSNEIAEEITGKTCIEYNEEDVVGIGFTYSDGVFVNPNPPGVGITLETYDGPVTSLPTNPPDYSSVGEE